MIHARGLVQTFTTKQGRKKVEVRAVDGVDLDVAEGEVVGFLGPNGAGKTTTLRMLTTLLRPTAGTATVAGYDVVRQSQQVRRSIGYVSQAGGASSYARAGDEVVDHGMLYGLSQAAGDRSAASELFEQLDLPGLWKRTPKQMSGGQKRRLDIVMGLIHDPTLIFLDEPTTGLDPQARANLWEHIADLRSERGATVFLTTHYLDEADALSDRIMIIDQGRIVASDTAENLKAAVSGDLVDLEVADSSRVSDAATALQVDRRATSRSTASTSAVGSREPAAPCPACCASSTAPASTSTRSRCTARPSTTSSSPSPAGRCATPRPSRADQPVLEGAEPVSFVRESYIVFRRQVRMNLRNPAWVLIGVMQPVLYLVLFGPLLKPLVGRLPGADNAYTFLVPGPARAAGHVRRVLRRLRPDRRVARGRRSRPSGSPRPAAPRCSWAG